MFRTKPWAKPSESCASQALLSLTATEASIIAMTSERLRNVDSDTYNSKQVSEFGKWMFGIGITTGFLITIIIANIFDWWTK